MNSNELRSILCQAIQKTFKTGAYACDQLNNVKSDQFAIIVNSDDSNHAAMHWLAIFKERNHDIEFFDSFGMSISFYSPHIKLFLKKFGKRIVQNRHQIQSNFSNTCGNFCVYYLLHRVRGWSMTSILKDFTLQNLYLNDEKVYLFVKLNFTQDYYTNSNLKRTENVDEESRDESLCSSQSCKSFKHTCKCT